MAPPRIVILDGYTLNPGDLSWEPLAALGAVTGFDRTAPADIVARARGADIVLTNKTPLSADTLAQLAGLRYIGVLATGYNAVDGAAARARGIPVTNIPEYGTRAVAEHALALLLELARHVGEHAASVRAGRWTASVDWCYWDHPMIELAGRRLGIIGPGRIGQAFAGLGAALGMSVEFARRSGGPSELARVLAQSDVVSLHCPLTAETRGLIRAETLALMKPTALLINTSRGGLINEADLAAALNTERLAGAGLDVLSVEPPAKDNPLLSAKHCLITPHNAWGAQDTRARLMDRAAANLRAFLAGHPIHVVN